MFENTLVESRHLIHARSGRIAILSFMLQASVLMLLFLLPLFQIQPLPEHVLRAVLITPPAPIKPIPIVQPAQTAPSTAAYPTDNLSTTLHTPARIFDRIRQPDAAPMQSFTDSMSVMGTSGVSQIFATSIAAPSIAVATEKPHGPVRISSGVAQGQLLNSIHPVYPAIAIAARVQGTVVIEATISRSGLIENLRVLSGPAMLVSSALSAVRTARYKPYLLNGEPVEVQTTIQVVFSLGG